MSTAKKKPARKRGSVIHISNLFKDEGSKRRIQRALQERPETFGTGMRAELERYSIDSLKAATEDIGQLLDQRAPLRGGRAEGAKGKRTQRLEKQFDKLYRDNPDCSSEEIRRYKAPPNIRGMPPGTVANHWTAAKKRSQK